MMDMTEKINDRLNYGHQKRVCARRVYGKNSGVFTNVRVFSFPNINILCLFRLCCALLGSAPQASVV